MPNARLIRYLLLPTLLICGIWARLYFFPHSAFYGIFVLIIIFTALFIRPYRTVIILFVVFLMGIWRMDSVLPHTTERFQCTGTWQMRDFADENSPFGERLPLTLIDGDCPLLRGLPVLAVRYAPPQAQLGDTFHTTLTIRPTERRFYTTLQSDQPTIQYNVPPFVALRAAIYHRIHQQYAYHQKWASALILGDRRNLSTQDKEMLKRSGTSHLLAISGLHLAIIIGAFYFVSRFIWSSHSSLFTRAEPRSMALLVAFIAGAIFVILTGAHPPIIRAWIMFACIALSWYFPNTIQSGILSLPIAIMLILLYDPTTLTDIGAWLSFLATIAILLLYPKLKNRPPYQQWIGLQLALTILLTPITWAIFGGISLTSFITNLIIVPWLGVVLILLIASLVIPSLTPIADQALTAYLTPIHLAAAPNAVYLTPLWQPSILTALCFYCLLISLIAPPLRRHTLILAIISITSILLPFILPHTKRLPTRISSEIHYLSPRQAIVINTGYHYKSQNDAARYILPELRHRAAKPIAIILTNPSPYATTGIATLLTAYPDTPIYTTIPIRDIPFTIHYCPDHSHHPAIQFTHQNGQCQLKINPN